MTKRPDEIFFENLVGTKESQEKLAVAAIEATAPSPRPLSSKSIFSHPDAHPVVLDLALLKHFQLEWFTWLPETLFSEIEKTFKTSIADVNRLKIMAAKTLHVVDSFWDHWEIFEKAIQALNGMPPQLDVMQPPDLPLLLAGVDMANSLRKEEYHEQVARYCAAVFLYENVHYAPEPLEFCQPFITQPTYHCKDCGKTASALQPFDGLCSSCAGHFNKPLTLDFKPDKERLDKGFGRNITLGVTYDPAPVKARFEAFDKMDPQRLSAMTWESPEDIQAAKLITAVDFKNFRAQQLKDQLGSLRGWLEMA
jgi:hypothetical protein